MHKPEKHKCTEPGCGKEYDDAAHLGIHRRAAHGIAGTSHGAIKARKDREAAKAAAEQAAPPTKRTYKKRSKTLETLPQAIPPVQSNGQSQTNSQTWSAPRRFHAEAAVAVAYGRFQELCKGVAFEYDLPGRSFTAQFVAFLHAETLR